MSMVLLTLWTKKRHLEGWIGPFNAPLSFPWALTPLSLRELIYFIIIFVSGLMIPVCCHRTPVAQMVEHRAVTWEVKGGKGMQSSSEQPLVGRSVT